jgi:hypothetical protein
MRSRNPAVAIREYTIATKFARLASRTFSDRSARVTERPRRRPIMGERLGRLWLDQGALV